MESSIYPTDKDAIVKFYDLLESFFAILHKNKIDSVTLTLTEASER
jgi:hypothetical protein